MAYEAEVQAELAEEKRLADIRRLEDLERRNASKPAKKKGKGGKNK